MTPEEATTFLRKVCAEYIRDLAVAQRPATAEAIAARCEQAFTVLSAPPVVVARSAKPRK